MKYNVSLEDVKTINTRENIPDLLNKMQVEYLCEIGVKEGENFRRLLRGTFIKKAVAIDIWQDTGVLSQSDDPELDQLKLDQLYLAMKRLESTDHRVEVIKDFSPQVSNQFSDNYFDFVYIDADHTEAAVYADLNAWWSKVRQGGILAGHDYCEAIVAGTVEFGVIQAVNRFVADNNLELHVDQDLPWRNWFIPKPV